MTQTQRHRFQKVAGLMGGPSAERPISLKSGAAVVAGLRQAGYDVAAVDVADREVNLPQGVEAVFIAMHGVFGEDGQVQAILDRRGIPYTGSGAVASRAAMDKIMTKLLLVEQGIPTPDFEVLRRGDRCSLPLPVVAKPVCEGSSIGVNYVFDEGAWDGALAATLEHGDTALVERFIEGRELTVGIVADEALPVVEIVPPKGRYDFFAKYTKGASRYQVPALVDPRLAAGCQDAALRAFRALGCRGMARVDFRARPDGQFFALEVNTIPGFTETSLLPMAAGAAGIGFSDLCALIMETAQCGGRPAGRGGLGG